VIFRALLDRRGHARAVSGPVNPVDRRRRRPPRAQRDLQRGDPRISGRSGQRGRKTQREEQRSDERSERIGADALSARPLLSPTSRSAVGSRHGTRFTAEARWANDRRRKKKEREKRRVSRGRPGVPLER
jgi:hypothetical protein